MFYIGKDWVTMRDIPGNLIPTRKDEWLNLLLRSENPADVKLAGYVLHRTARFNKKHLVTLTNCSLYTVSLVLKVNSDEAADRVQVLLDGGWLWDTGIKVGARYAYALTVNVEPQKLKR